MFEEYLELFCTYLLSINRAESTIRDYRKDVEKFLAFVQEKGVQKLDEIDVMHIDLYQASLMKVNRSSTVIRRMRALNSFFKYLRGRKYIAENPMEVVEVAKMKDSDRKKRESLTKEEAKRLIRSTEQHSIPSLKLRNKILMISFVFFGLRVSELCDLRVEDVSFRDKTVYIFDGKGGKNREVPLFDELIEPFKEYLGTKKVKSEYFFTKKQTSEPLQPRAVLDLVKRHAKKARLIRKNIGCHSLRVTSATFLYEDGHDPRTIQKFLGHSSINTTMIYINEDIEKTKHRIRSNFSFARLKREEKKAQKKEK